MDHGVPRHCAATSAPRNCCFNCRAGQSSKDNARCRTTRSERSPTFAAQLHLPAHDLFWALLRVHLHLLPLDLAWNHDMQTQLLFLNYADAKQFSVSFGSCGRNVREVDQTLMLGVREISPRTCDGCHIPSGDTELPFLRRGRGRLGVNDFDCGWLQIVLTASFDNCT